MSSAPNAPPIAAPIPVLLTCIQMMQFDTRSQEPLLNSRYFFFSSPTSIVRERGAVMGAFIITAREGSYNSSRSSRSAEIVDACLEEPIVRRYDVKGIPCMVVAPTFFFQFGGNELPPLELSASFRLRRSRPARRSILLLKLLSIP